MQATWSTGGSPREQGTPCRGLRAGFLALSAALLLLCVPLIAQTAVSPSRVELDLDAGPSTESIRVFNYNRDDVEVEVEVVHWDLDESNQVRTIEPTEQSLDQWIIVQPMRFSIPAGQSQTVRFSVRPRLEPEPGEHRGMIYFNQQPITGEPGFQILFKVGVAVYGHAGEVIRTLSLHGVEVSGGVAKLDLESSGTAHARLSGQWAVWPEAVFPGTAATAFVEGLDEPETPRPEGIVAVGALPSTPILPGTRRQIAIELLGAEELTAGRYVLDFNGTIGDTVLDRSVGFEVGSPGDASAKSNRLDEAASDGVQRDGAP